MQNRVFDIQGLKEDISAHGKQLRYCFPIISHDEKYFIAGVERWAIEKMETLQEVPSQQSYEPFELSNKESLTCKEGEVVFLLGKDLHFLLSKLGFENLGEGWTETKYKARLKTGSLSDFKKLRHEIFKWAKQLFDKDLLSLFTDKILSEKAESFLKVMKGTEANQIESVIIRELAIKKLCGDFESQLRKIKLFKRRLGYTLEEMFLLVEQYIQSTENALFSYSRTQRLNLFMSESYDTSSLEKVYLIDHEDRITSSTTDRSIDA